ncbi:hypothetical protein N7451_001754 [Penicillium sp. IBT 35674x]|nr:hypothetical protein N7451_001754 [Penicillium sp. IBT 35674x]
MQSRTFIKHTVDSNVIRISPNHLHINDLDFFYEVFRVNSDFLKPPHFYERLQAPGSLATATNPNEHRILRRRVGPLFSSKATEKMAHSVKLKVRQAAENSAAFIGKGSAFNTQTLFRSIALDILCAEYFGGSVDFIENLEDASNLWAALDTIVRQTWKFQVARIPYLTKFAFGLPDWLVRSLVPDYVKFKQRCAIFLDQSLRQRRLQRYEHSGSHVTFFDLLMEPIPSQKGFSLSRENLVGQAIGLVIAGVDTTSLSLTTAFYNILSSPEVESCLVAELEDARPLIRNGLEFHEIQKLPYLVSNFRLPSGPLTGNNNSQNV